MRSLQRLVLVALVLALAVPALAQRSTAALRGTVEDASGGVIRGARVKVANEETGLVRTTETNADGLYTVAELPVGTYRVEVEAEGFKAAARTKITLNVADTRAVDFELETGAVTEVVTVEADVLAVQLVGGEVSGLITGEQARELPLNGRNFLQLATLMPGVSAPDFLNVKDKGLLGGSDLSISGGAVTANLWTVDGANNNDVGSNRTILIYPSVDAIEEFKILRNSYGAEYGQSGGAQISIVTRAGTNNFTGGMFYSGRNDALNCDQLLPGEGGQREGGAETARLRVALRGAHHQGQAPFLRVPGMEQGEARHGAREQRADGRGAQGDFSASDVPGCSTIPNDPLTGAPFPGNRIPADRLSPGGPAPAPALPGAEHRAGSRELQQLGGVAHHPDQLPAGEHPSRLQRHRPARA